MVSQIGGRQGKHFKAFEQLRVKQEAIVAEQQAIFYMLAKTSQVQLSLESAVNNIDELDDDSSSVSVSLRRDLYDHLLEASAFSEHVLHALSDSVHIIGAELSEFERQRDDEIVRGAAGDDSYRSACPRAEPTKYVKDAWSLCWEFLRICGEFAKSSCRQKIPQLAAGAPHLKTDCAPALQLVGNDSQQHRSRERGERHCSLY